VGVLGDGLDGDAADLHQRCAPQHRAAAAEERGVPQVVAVLHQAVEQLGLVGHDAEGLQVALDRVGRVEEVRRLQHRQLQVAQEGAHRHLQERARGHVVAVEDRDELAIRARQRRVEVAGLGMQVVAAGEVAHAAGLAELPELLAAAVVEQVDPQLVDRPVHRLGRQHRAAHHIQRLVVGRNEDVDGGPQAAVLGQGHRLALERHRRLQVTQQQDGQRVELGQQQAPAEHAADHVVEVQRAGQPPVHVAQ
jgi:hypothetical protein